MNPKLSKVLTIRMGQGQYNEIARLAKDYGDTPTSFARFMLLFSADQLQQKKATDPMMSLCAVTTRIYRSHLMLLQAIEMWTHGAFAVDDHMDTMIRKANEDLKHMQLVNPRRKGPVSGIDDEWGWP